MTIFIYNDRYFQDSKENNDKNMDFKNILKEISSSKDDCIWMVWTSNIYKISLNMRLYNNNNENNHSRIYC